MKTCIIYNQKLTWIMRVDGISLAFTGRDCAEYFRKHYFDLGYRVIFDGEVYKDDLCYT